MLKVIEPFLSQNWKKRREYFTEVAMKSRALLDYFCNLVSRFSLILTKILLSIESNASDYRALFIES